MDAQATVKITPEMMAQAFWEMSEFQQADFFTSLAKVISKDFYGGNGCAYSLGELQWFALEKCIRNKDGSGTPASDVLMSMAAPHFRYTLKDY